MLLEKIKKRINYLNSQISAGGRLDGWSLAGAKKELKNLKLKLNEIY
tara:strand:+ start:208 stop:348 length:141 start_codon:yes stop_codon:yes gene_type:complete